MALAHAILASLINSPRSGYDLAKYFAEMISHYWSASQQHIYRELSKLEEQGYITGETVYQENRPNKTIYHITELGQQELVEWITQPYESSPIRDDLLVKVHCGYLVPKTVIRQDLEQCCKTHLEKLLHFREREPGQNFHTLSREKQFSYLTLRRGIRYEAEWVTWCEEALELLETIVED